MKKIFSSQWSKKIIFWYFLGFLWSFTRKTPKNLKKQSVSIIVSIFVKKISPNNVRDFFFLLFIREKKICLWTLWNFSWPSATRNFKIGFTRKCSSHSWTGEKRSLTVGKIFFTQKRDNYTNKVLFPLNLDKIRGLHISFPIYHLTSTSHPARQAGSKYHVSLALKFVLP